MKKLFFSILLLFNLLFGSNKILNYQGKILQNGNGNGIEIHKNFIKRGFRLNRLADISEEYLRSITVHNNFIYIGTGLSGKIYRYNGKEVVLFADSVDANVNVIHVFDSILYAGTSPGGMLYQFSNDKVIKKIKTGEYSINDILKVGGKIYMATSSNGKILQYNGKKVKLWHQFDATSVSQLRYHKGLFYAFCSDPASVFILNKHGNILRSYQFQDDEIATSFLDDKYIFIGVNSKGGIDNIKSAIYRLSMDFSSCIKLAESDNAIHSINSIANKIIYSVGDNGILYAIEKNKYSLNPIKIREADNLIFSKLLRYHDKLYAISSHKGELYLISPSRDGYYITKPIYFGFPVKLARISIISSEKTDFYYRIGNTTNGDSIQSEWKKYNKNPLIPKSPQREPLLNGPLALYLQIKIDLHNNNKIYGFKIYYEKGNPPPVIDSVILSPPGILYTNGYSLQHNKKAEKAKILRLENIGFTIKRNAKDADNANRSIQIYTHSEDNKRLFYIVRLKSLFSGKFYNISKKDSSSFIILKTEKYPDGQYQIVVSAKSSDGQSGTYQTAPFIIDNSPPAVIKYSISGSSLNISTIDTTGIYDIEYCTKGSDWKQVNLQINQIYMKKAKIKIPIKKGFDFVIIRLTDLFGNSGYFTLMEKNNG